VSFHGNFIILKLKTGNTVARLEMSREMLNSIMLIDDDEVTNVINESVIENSKVCKEIHTFPNAIKGFDFFRECSEETCPELVFIDLKMPILDGFDFLIEFKKAFPQYLKTPKFIMLTTSNRKEDRDMAISLGFDDYEVKPLNEEKLKRIIKKHFPLLSSALVL
jgi:CheY-like chemotaxis protein